MCYVSLHLFSFFIVKSCCTALCSSAVMSLCLMPEIHLLGFEGSRVLKEEPTQQSIQVYYISTLLPLSVVTYYIGWTTGKCNIERLAKRTANMLYN